MTDKFYLIIYAVNFIEKKLLVKADNVLNAKKQFVLIMRAKGTKNYFIKKVEWLEYGTEDNEN